MTLVLKADKALTAPKDKLPNISDALAADFSALDLTGANGAAVSTWPSKGVLAGWALLQATAASQPTLSTNADNTGVKAVNLTAPNQYLQTSLDAVDLAMPATITMMMRLRDIATSRYIFSGGNVDAVQRYLQGSVATSLGSAVLNTAGGATTLTGAPITANTWVVVTWVFGGTAAESAIYVDGIKQVTKTFADADLTKTYLPRLTIGASAGGGTTRLDGWISHIRVTSRSWTAAEAAAANTYLRKLYGLTA